MIFLTVGTLFPFDRLVRAVDSAVGKGLIKDEVFAQIGCDSFKPKNMGYVELLDKNTFDKKVNKATHLISHAGIGTITMALDFNKPILVMPRRKHLKEHVNDHQVATARKFEELGHVLVAYKTEELLERIEHLRNFIPSKRKAQPEAVAERIANFLRACNKTMFI